MAPTLLPPRTRLARLLAAALALTAAFTGSGVDARASTDTYPSKPITLVVPFPPGGSNDQFARVIALPLSQALKQPVVVDNRPGAGGNLGAAAVARSPADGYTLLIASSTFASNAAIQPKIPYDPVKSFAPIGQLARSPLVVAANLQFPASNPAEMLAVLRQHPDRYNYASGGSGSLSHFSTELLKAKAGDLRITHIPYKGTGPALTELIGNQTQLFIASAPILMPAIRTGKVKGLGITSLAPSPVAPGLAPMASVVPGYAYETWWGFLAPAGTPPAVVEKLNAELNRIIRTPALRDSLLREGAEAAPGTPAQFGAVIVQDLERLKQLARQQNIVVD